MATLTLSDAQVIEVRLLLGSHLTTDDVSDEQIRSQVILGAASDYVFEKIREGMDIASLPANEQTIARRFADETDDDITNFINVVLKPPQRGQMERAVMYRCAGLCVPIVSNAATGGVNISRSAAQAAQVIAENAGGIGHRFQPQSEATQEVIARQISRRTFTPQEDFFQRADEELVRLNQAFPDDAFKSRVPKYNLFTTARR